MPTKLQAKLLAEEYYSKHGEERQRYYTFLRANRRAGGYDEALKIIKANTKRNRGCPIME